MKKRKLENTCCSCHEDALPDLLLVGCSNRHTICHVCARLFITSKIKMHHFPRNFPGSINFREDLKCPLCQEFIHGVSNIFVNTEEDEKLYMCPYHEFLPNEENCTSKKTLNDLHQHLLAVHKHTIKCPNCFMWLHKPDMSLDDMLRDHISESCQSIRCLGCKRRGNLVQMYTHSATLNLVSIDDEKHVCDASYVLFSDFAKQLSEINIHFETTEYIHSISLVLLQWIIQYTNDCSSGNIVTFYNNPIIPKLIAYWFISLHNFVDSELTRKLKNAIQLNQDKIYHDLILICITSFAQKYHKKIDAFNELPFIYRLLCMVIMNFNNGKNLFQQLELNFEPNSEILSNVERLNKFIPPPQSPRLIFQLPENWYLS